MSRSRHIREHRRARRAAVRAMLWPKLTAPLLDAWNFAREFFADIAGIFITPADLAEREYMRRTEHRELADLVRHLELLTRRIFLAAALALNFLIRPLAERLPRPRKRRRYLYWLDRPETWRARFSTFRRRPPARQRYARTPGAPALLVPTFALARRFEAVRRALVDPDRHIRRLAIRLGRFDARNRISNDPVALEARPWRLARPGHAPTRGARWIRTCMAVVDPMIHDQFDRWNEATEPG